MSEIEELTIKEKKKIIEDVNLVGKVCFFEMGIDLDPEEREGGEIEEDMATLLCDTRTHKEKSAGVSPSIDLYYQRVSIVIEDNIKKMEFIREKIKATDDCEEKEFYNELLELSKGSFRLARQIDEGEKGKEGANGT